MVPADRDLGIAARFLGQEKSLVKFAQLLERFLYMVGDVEGVLEIL
jgi:hypothetical protein